MRELALIACLAVTPLLGGCVAKTLIDVATLPVRATAKAVDLATTSQSEADENRGRELRKREQRLGELERDHAKQIRRCEDGNERACDASRRTYAEMQQLLPTIPVQPQR